MLEGEGTTMLWNVGNYSFTDSVIPEQPYLQKARLQEPQISAVIPALYFVPFWLLQVFVASFAMLRYQEIPTI